MFSSFRHERCFDRLLGGKNAIEYTHDHQVSVISHFTRRQAYPFNSLRYVPYGALSEVRDVVYRGNYLFIGNPSR